MARVRYISKARMKRSDFLSSLGVLGLAGCAQ